MVKNKDKNLPIFYTYPTFPDEVRNLKEIREMYSTEFW